MSFYTKVERFGNNLRVREITDSGSRNDYVVEYEPTFYVPDSGGQWKSIHGNKLKPVNPGNMSDCREYLNLYGSSSNTKVYGNEDYVAQYIADKYSGDIKYDLTQIRIANYDIEVASENGFPRPELANEMIWAITLYDNHDDVYYVFAVGHWALSHTELDFITDENVSYIHCTSEKDLLVRFANHMNNAKYDILTGWNIEGFDIPYMVNRTKKILGDSAIKKFSPWGKVREKTLRGMYGKEQQTYTFDGMSVVDYMALYKKFTYKAQESYSLDHIAYVELGEKKLDYSEYGNLHSLYQSNFQKAVDYNIKDVNLVKRLDDKMKLLDLIATVAYYAKVNFNDVFSPVKTWDSLIYNYLLEQNIAVPPKKHSNKSESFAGAFVKPITPGFRDWVVSCDLNGLYPHLIMEYNLGPETILDYVPDEYSDVIINSTINADGKKEVDSQLVDGTHNMPANSDYAIAANGSFYSKNEMSVFSAIMRRLYDDRKVNKKIMLEWEQKKVDGNNSRTVINNISKYNNIQMAMKILANAGYGAIGNPHFRYFNLAVAEAITLSGQLSIKWIVRKLNVFLNKLLNTENVDYCFYADTDSSYIELKEFVNQVYMNKEITNEEDVVNLLDKFCKNVLEVEIEKGYEELAEYMNAYENKMVMKRETICSRGFWTAKKRYVLNVWDSEGVRYKKPKLKIMGLEAKKSDTPEICRKELEEVYRLMLETDKQTVQSHIAKFKYKWRSLPPEQIAISKSCNNMGKYSDKTNIYKKGTPMQVKGSLIHNDIIKKNSLNVKEIQDGDKIKMVTLKIPNPTPDKVISFSNYLPEELGLDEFVDYSAQFEKAFIKPVSSALDAVGWSVEDEGDLESFFV